jgi:hypothetical protein
MSFEGLHERMRLDRLPEDTKCVAVLIIGNTRYEQDRQSLTVGLPAYVPGSRFGPRRYYGAMGGQEHDSMKLYIGIDVYQYGRPRIITTSEQDASRYLKEEPKNQYRRVFVVDAAQMVLDEGAIEPSLVEF